MRLLSSTCSFEFGCLVSSGEVQDHWKWDGWGVGRILGKGLLSHTAVKVNFLRCGFKCTRMQNSLVIWVVGVTHFWTMPMGNEGHTIRGLNSAMVQNVVLAPRNISGVYNPWAHHYCVMPSIYEVPFMFNYITAIYFSNVENRLQRYTYSKMLISLFRQCISHSHASENACKMSLTWCTLLGGPLQDISNVLFQRIFVGNYLYHLYWLNFLKIFTDTYIT